MHWTPLLGNRSTTYDVRGTSLLAVPHGSRRRRSATGNSVVSFCACIDTANTLADYYWLQKTAAVSKFRLHVHTFLEAKSGVWWIASPSWPCGRRTSAGREIILLPRQTNTHKHKPFKINPIACTAVINDTRSDTADLWWVGVGRPVPTILALQQSAASGAPLSHSSSTVVVQSTK